MPFNFELLREIRLKDRIERSAFAKLLGISEDYLYRLESGQREPRPGLIEKISRCSGISIGAFFGNGEGDDRSEMSDRPGEIKNMTELINSLNRERSVRKTVEQRIFKLEKLNEHLLAANELNTRLTDILHMELPKSEKSKRIAALARATAGAGELRFDEIAGILHLQRATLRHWLESEKNNYSCRLFDGKTVTASTPGEAGMRLLCFDCEVRAREDCRGYGEENHPENIFVLIALLEAHGVYSRTEQAELLRDSYGIEMTAHQISELMSRKKHGKPVPEKTENMDMYKRG
jgi:transcriptional regulator with XRE-family HTH domain